MSDQKTAEHIRALMDRHARVAVLIDRLKSIWTLCVFDDGGGYEPVDQAWGDELAAELTWLNELYGEAIANQGDVRRLVIEPPRPVPIKPVDSKLQ